MLLSPLARCCSFPQADAVEVIIPGPDESRRRFGWFSLLVVAFFWVAGAFRVVGDRSLGRVCV
jgi:hypothetical protein